MHAKKGSHFAKPAHIRVHEPMPEQATSESPRDILEAAEIIPEPNHEELAHALGRLLAWILRARTLAGVGFRVMIVAYNVRPDLIGGKTLEEISHSMGYGRSAAHNQSREFQCTFGIRHLNQHAKSSK